MKVIIAPNGIGFHLKREHLEALFERAPQYFQEAMPASMMRLDNQSDTQLLEWYDTAVLRGEDMFFLDERSASLRTDVLLISIIEKEGSEVLTGSNHRELKVVEIPDDVQWFIRTEEDGSESIHEKHRVWR